MAQFRFYPDPDAWSDLVDRAFAGDAEAVEALTAVGPQRERELEDAAVAGVAGSNLRIGTVVSFDPVNQEADVSFGGDATTYPVYLGGWRLYPGNLVLVDTSSSVIVGGWRA